MIIFNIKTLHKKLYELIILVQTVLYYVLEGLGQTMKIAEVGNIIEFRDGLQGIVEKVNENSVIVDLTYMENFHELELEEKTVVNHKRYTILYGNDK